MTESKKLLLVENLHVTFSMPDYDILAVRGVSFGIERGKTLGLVGESGCGKSVTAFSILKLVPLPGVISSGSVYFNGKDLAALTDDEMRLVRGREIAMIFQEPMTSLNPVFTVGYQITESSILHCNMTKKEAREHAVELLDQVGIPSPSKRFDSYPHEFSGGMRQRVMIAMALAASPSMLIADEPTTALDVTIQAQILDLLLKIQEERSMSLLVITHDLGIVANIAADIAIMYAGEIVEYGTAAEVFTSPLHPYTKGLFDAIPGIGEGSPRLKTIPGTVPSISGELDECVFYPRCSARKESCLNGPIPVTTLGHHDVRCINALSVSGKK